MAFSKKILLKNPLLRLFSSFELALVCLALLLILTFWGTLHQIEYGLYQTQQKMFNSWFFLSAGILPFPGARLVLWVSLLNLIGVSLFKFQYTWKKSGILITHFGFMLLIISGGYTLHFAEESSLTLKEGQGSNVSGDYHHWELSFWTQGGKGDSTTKQVEAFALAGLKEESSLTLNNADLNMEVVSHYPNAKAFSAKDRQPSEVFLNQSGIVEMRREKASADPAENYPGVVLKLPIPSGPHGHTLLLLYGAEMSATSFTYRGKRIFAKLRRMRHPLPVLIELVDFKKEDYLGTQTAKSYQSRVRVHEEGYAREAVISMNKPLRTHGYTFYQSSFTPGVGGESSTFSVVKNHGRLLPYISSFTIGIGLIWHFAVMLVTFARRSRKKNINREPHA